VDGAVGARLVARLRDAGVFELAHETVRVDDVFAEIRLLSRLASVEALTGTRTLSAEQMVEVLRRWRIQLGQLSHPRVLADALTAAAHWNEDTARTMAERLLGHARLADRIRHPKDHEADHMVHLASVLHDLLTSRRGLPDITGLYGPDAVTTLADAASPHAWGSLLEVMAEAGSDLDWIAGHLRRRWASVEESALDGLLPVVHAWETFSAMGWAAWSLIRAGGPQVELPAPSDELRTALLRMAPVRRAWALTWLAGDWVAPIVDDAMASVRALPEPLPRPSDAAVALTIATARYQEDATYSITENPDWWRVACRTTPRWLAPLAAAVDDSPGEPGWSLLEEDELRALTARIRLERTWRRSCHAVGRSLDRARGEAV
jgi:hypothetical protein